MTDPPARPRRRRVLGVLFGVVVALAASEVFLRVTHLGVHTVRVGDYHFVRCANAPNCWTFDPAHPPELVWDGDPYGRLPPGARMTYEINAAGLRGPLPDPSRPAVLMVGDSFVFGEGVAYRDTFTARIERALSTRLSPPPALVDAGIPGYGSVHEAARLPEWLARFGPRAVVLTFLPNDAIPLDQSIARGDDLLNVDQEPPTSYLWRLVSNVLTRSARDREVEAWYRDYYTGSRSAYWDEARAAIVDMAKRSAQSGAKFGVTIFPILHRVKEQPFAEIHALVARTCRDIGVPCLDLGPVFAHETDRDLWVHPTDHHPDAYAHGIAAKAMTPFVESLLR